MYRLWTAGLLAVLTLLCGGLGCDTSLQHKAEDGARVDNPGYFADAISAYIKLRGCPPASLRACLVRDDEYARRFNQSGPEYVGVQLPYGSYILLKSFVDECELHFPKRPDALAVRNDELVDVETGKPTLLFSVKRIEYSFMRSDNVELFRRWELITKGEPTGVEWLDSLEREKVPASAPAGA